MRSRARIIRELGHVEGMDLSRAEGLVVAGDVIERGEREVVEDEVAVERVAVEPQLVTEADPRHVRARRGRQRARAVGPRRWLPQRGQRRRRHRSVRVLCVSLVRGEGAAAAGETEGKSLILFCSASGERLRRT